MRVHTQRPASLVARKHILSFHYNTCLLQKQGEWRLCPHHPMYIKPQQQHDAL